ncbi:nitroreductase [Planktosalinus lacus]|uniref:Nitroreductase n=2 Tax=Planktosalinus lacus TaxID=1526573 RepID=A0A8J2VB63_9FLAO|nr:nitroreductase [Planktosalinus lacus]
MEKMTSSIINDLNWRYATKKFDANKKLSEEKVEILKNAFNLTATSYGLQPIKLLVIENPTIKKELLPFSMHQKQVQDASHLLVFCVVTEIDADYVTNYFERVQNTRGTSQTILAPFRDILIQDFEQKGKDRIFAWAKNQAYLAMGNLLTVCALEKIDSCPIEGFEPEGYDSYLKLQEKGLRSVLVMPVGYRADDDFFADMKKVRKELTDSVIHYQ